MNVEKKILDLRKQIDNYDDRIVELLLERFILSRKIGDIKRESGVTISDPERENNIIDRLFDLFGDKLDREDIAAIFAPVYHVSKKHQVKK